MSYPKEKEPQSMHRTPELGSHPWAGESPDDREEFLLHGEDGQVLPLLQNRLLLGKLAAGLAFLLHVVGKLLLCPENTPTRPKCPAWSPASSLLTGLLPCFLCPEVRTAPNTQRIFEMRGLPAAAHLLWPKGPHCCLSIHHPKPAQHPRDRNPRRAPKSCRSVSMHILCPGTVHPDKELRCTGHT